MTAREKVRAIETIREDLARNERHVKSPDWHFDQLKAREQRSKAGKEEAPDWNATRKELRRRHPSASVPVEALPSRAVHRYFGHE